MNIQPNILKYYLKNCLFINGTAYAGKSTMCRMLAKKHGLLLCGENYGMDTLMEIVTQEQQPNLNYFHTMKDWQAFLSRTPEEYAAWIRGNAYECTDFEIAELISLSRSKRVIVDTNIPAEILKQIADYRQVAIMLSPPAQSVDLFFQREDPEKQFLLSQLRQAPDPEKAMENFRNCLAAFNSQEIYDAWRSSGFFTLARTDFETDTRLETLELLERHFGLCPNGKPADASPSAAPER